MFGFLILKSLFSGPFLFLLIYFDGLWFPELYILIILIKFLLRCNLATSYTIYIMYQVFLSIIWKIVFRFPSDYEKLTLFDINVYILSHWVKTYFLYALLIFKLFNYTIFKHFNYTSHIWIHCNCERFI